MRRSLLSRPMFFPIVVASFVAGNALDLIGTYVHQPDFQSEANLIYSFLKGHGYSPGWPEVITAKLVMCVICATGLRQFLRRRRDFYCSPAATFREFITHFFYGRTLLWLQTLYRIPRFLPTLLGLFAVWSVGGPYYAYLGYDNLAAEYGWRSLGGNWVGSVWIDHGLILWAILGSVWLCWDLWRDYRDIYRDDTVQTKVVA